jgi:DNA-binding transcriptional MocR family regulator
MAGGRRHVVLLAQVRMLNGMSIPRPRVLYTVPVGQNPCGTVRAAIKRIY